MSFCTAFADLRKARRIPMRGFEDTVGIPSSYINAIEKESLLPGPDKLDLIAKVFVAVAREQKAANPEEDRDILFQERHLTRFERVARQIAKELEKESYPDLAEPLRETLRLLDGLDTEHRVEFAHNALPELVEAVPGAVAEAISKSRLDGGAEDGEVAGRQQTNPEVAGTR